MEQKSQRVCGRWLCLRREAETLQLDHPLARWNCNSFSVRLISGKWVRTIDATAVRVARIFSCLINYASGQLLAGGIELLVMHLNQFVTAAV
jgi:hypothetical protein